MRTNEAATHLGVIWALVTLTEQKKIHSVKNIMDVIGYPQLSNKTVIRSLDYLEKLGVIRGNYEKKKRQGKRDLRYIRLCPQKIPKEVYKLKIPQNTAYRHTLNAYHKGIARRENKKIFYNAKGLSDLLGTDFIKKVIENYSKTKNVQHPNPDKLEADIFKRLDGAELDIDENTLEIFHRYICWKVNLLHDDVQSKAGGNEKGLSVFSSQLYTKSIKVVSTAWINYTTIVNQILKDRMRSFTHHSSLTF